MKARHVIPQVLISTHFSDSYQPSLRIPCIENDFTADVTMRTCLTFCFFVKMKVQVTHVYTFMIHRSYLTQRLGHSISTPLAKGTGDYTGWLDNRDN